MQVEVGAGGVSKLDGPDFEDVKITVITDSRPYCLRERLPKYCS